MPNLTSRLQLVQPLTSEAYDVGVPNGNMALIDAAPANVTICTSATRPSTPDAGDLIYETDSQNLLARVASAWVAHTGRTFICTSGTRPGSSLTYGGFLITETDTGASYMRNAANSAWVYVAGTFLPSAQVITWNNDTFMARTSAGVLRTDGDFRVMGSISVPRGIIARSRRVTASSTTTTIIGVRRYDDLPILAGRCYVVETSGLGMDSTVNNDEIFVEFHYTTDGSTPTTASTYLPGSYTSARQTDSNVPEHKVIRTTYTPAGNETLSLLLCVGRVAGTGNVSITTPISEFAEFTVADGGIDPGNSGTNI